MEDFGKKIDVEKVREPTLEQLREQLAVLKNTMVAFGDVIPADRAEVARLEKLIVDKQNAERPKETDFEKREAEKAIIAAKDWGELYKALDEIGSLTSSSSEKPAAEIKRKIDSVRRVLSDWPGVNIKELADSSPVILTITRSHGLRNKVLELLKAERDQVKIPA